MRLPTRYRWELFLFDALVFSGLAALLCFAVTGGGL